MLQILVTDLESVLLIFIECCSWFKWLLICPAWSEFSCWSIRWGRSFKVSYQLRFRNFGLIFTFFKLNVIIFKLFKFRMFLLCDILIFYLQVAQLVYSLVSLAHIWNGCYFKSVLEFVNASNLAFKFVLEKNWKCNFKWEFLLFFKTNYEKVIFLKI